jgi:hypothetical protein
VKAEGSGTVAAEEEVPASPSGAVSDTSALPDQAPPPPMMVFGPMLALAALEYLFFGDLLRAALEG